MGSEEGSLDLGNTCSSLGVAKEENKTVNGKFYVPDLGSVQSLLVDGLFDLGLGGWIGSNGSVGLLLHLLDVLGVDASLEKGEFYRRRLIIKVP